MSVYDYVCNNTECVDHDVPVSQFATSREAVFSCKRCGSTMQRKFPKKVNVIDSTKSMNGVPLGKAIQEKNEQLREKWGGYSNEKESLHDTAHKAALEKRSKS